ncbi:MAG TPA: hypothetical protein VH280_14545 [Verrucomicrobiae bacterium]|jgi:tetratricopeptide (TPR) repeat protein|nr:hypothetical protein [Verrucomicrobiae bacterium]
MNTETPILSESFQRLYFNATVFENYSSWHPIRLNRVLPFQATDLVMDNPGLLAAEGAYLANPDIENRFAVVEAFCRCGLLSPEDGANLKPVLDIYGADFFEFMGEVYANAGMFICALRWQREYIAVLEVQNSGARSDSEEVYVDVGYCLYSLGLFAEAIAWTKSCAGPDLIELTVGTAMMENQARLMGGRLVATERANNRVRYTGSTMTDANIARESAEQLKTALKAAMPFKETYIDWVRTDALISSKPVEGCYPFRRELATGCLLGHKMNLLFATAAEADYLIECGNKAEAQRLLQEAVLLEPQADFIRERLATIT